MENKKHGLFNNVLFFTALQYAQLLKKALKTHFIPTTIQCKNHEPELRFCAGSNPASDVSEIRRSEDF